MKTRTNHGAEITLGTEHHHTSEDIARHRRLATEAIGFPPRSTNPPKKKRGNKAQS